MLGLKLIRVSERAPGRWFALKDYNTPARTRVQGYFKVAQYNIHTFTLIIETE